MKIQMSLVYSVSLIDPFTVTGKGKVFLFQSLQVKWNLKSLWLLPPRLLDKRSVYPICCMFKSLS